MQRQFWQGVVVLAVLAVCARVGAEAPPAPDVEGASLAPLAPENTAAEEPLYDPPEYDLSRGGGREAADRIRGFLEQHPGSPLAPRAALDLHMLGAVHKDKALADEALARLVFDFPASLPTSYLLTTFGQNQQPLRGLLAAAFGKQRQMTPDFGGRFARGVELGVRNWGPGFLSGDEFLLQTALAAQAGEVLGLELLCRERLRQAGKEAQEIARISFDRDASARDKFLALQAVRDSEPARLYQRYYFEQLTPEEQSEREIREPLVQNLLAQREFAQALPLVEELMAEQSSDRLLYWRGWCESSLGRPALAEQSFAALLAEHPDSPYRPAAVELQEALASGPENLSMQLEALHAALAELRTGGEQIEARFEFTPRDRAPFQIYAAIEATSQEQLEVHVQREGRTLLAYRTAPGDCRLYTQGEAAIHAYHQGGAFLAPQFNILPRPGGGYDFSWNVNLQGAPGGMQRAFQSLLSSPFTSREGLQQFLTHFTTRGGAPAGVAQRDGQTVHAWLFPSADGPELTRHELGVSPEGRLVSISTSRFQCRSLRYGRRGDFEFSPPAWPDLPVVEQEKFDGAMMFRLMGAAVELMQNK